MAELDIQDVQAVKDVIGEADVAYTEYMRIVVNSEEFLVPVNAVLNIIRPVSLTPVPMAPDHLLGLANVKGQVFCMIDPGKLLNLPNKRKEKTDNSRFLLLRHARVRLGIWVEEVLDLYRITASQLKEGTGQTYEAGKAETPQGLLPVLSVEALFD